ncbi:cytosine permease [Vibrio chagasii]|nr:cytosine permease [Vibrio chagasii]
MAADNNYSLGPVPTDHVAASCFTTMVMLGLTFLLCKYVDRWFTRDSLSFNDFFLAVLIGNPISVFFTLLLGYIGSSTGSSLPSPPCSFLFGTKGSWLPSALLGGTQVGWFGVGVWDVRDSSTKATGIDTNTLIIVSGLLMTGTVYFGIKSAHGAVSGRRSCYCNSGWLLSTDSRRQ